MKREKKDSKRWILLALLVLILLLLLGFCSRKEFSGVSSEQGQLQPAVAQSTEIASVGAEPTALPMAAEPLPSSAPCTIDHPFFPIRLGAIWEYRTRSIYTRSVSGEIGVDRGWESGGEVLEVVELSDTQAMIIGYTRIGVDAGPENWYQEYPIWCNNEEVWSFPSIAYILPHVLSPNSIYQSWTGQGQLTDYQVSDWQEITVPAGTFDVLCVSFSYPQEVRPNYVTSGVSCFAEGVGLVYDEGHADIPGEDGYVSSLFSELESYSIPTG
ncbi:MAG: hypothetical protein XU08_C0002G0092 [candidate division WWE3 bacterium CSP1-7]|uniref:Uncharacterized protein n=1 Tax=candidate division WWE3 bacterium CSP1-7 TaxID=1576480 RepID=A0A0T5ZXK0_UNCKA|nr:MAG: hypothetical protein XU08_C0002G0092 [candidate division WWE3 bacterium CSP1-7]